MSRLNVGIAGIVMTLMGVAVMPKDSTAHQGNDTPAANPANLSTSVGECKVCHSDPTAIGLRDFEKCGSKTLIRLDESVIWENDDSHRRAYAALISPLGRQMGERLKSDMTTNLACLACHATDTQPKSATKSLAQFVRSESLGIGCQACHGVGKTWQNEHYQIEETPGRSTIPWRTKSPAEKDKAGMINLRNPEIKASLCVSSRTRCMPRGIRLCRRSSWEHLSMISRLIGNCHSILSISNRYRLIRPSHCIRTIRTKGETDMPRGRP
jgi:Cytochrome c554 and c-prime